MLGVTCTRGHAHELDALVCTWVGRTLFWFEGGGPFPPGPPGLAAIVPAKKDFDESLLAPSSWYTGDFQKVDLRTYERPSPPSFFQRRAVLGPDSQENVSAITRCSMPCQSFILKPAVCSAQKTLEWCRPSTSATGTRLISIKRHWLESNCVLLVVEIWDQFCPSPDSRDLVWWTRGPRRNNKHGTAHKPWRKGKCRICWNMVLYN